MGLWNGGSGSAQQRRGCTRTQSIGMGLAVFSGVQLEFLFLHFAFRQCAFRRAVVVLESLCLLACLLSCLLILFYSFFVGELGKALDDMILDADERASEQHFFFSRFSFFWTRGRTTSLDPYIVLIPFLMKLNSYSRDALASWA